RADAGAVRSRRHAGLLEGRGPRQVLQAAGSADLSGALALRRSALRVDPAGTLHGRVVSARSAPDAVRLTVDVEGVGEVHAVAAVGDRDTMLGVGNDIRLAVDLNRTARLAG